ncbi:alpha/beta fold hydrolase [Actinoplanes sp. NPDC049265]|uniref:alpha/beta fold hydrolase n=1 Tax=Actinoplanes sp. NPDC049265 TaxID=3363902 RepID=UPI00371A1B96
MSTVTHGDIVVVIPGILGSVLYRGTDQVWGYRQIVTNLHRLPQRLTRDLALPADAFEQPAEEGYDDGVRATGVLRTQAIVPGFWAVDGYDVLLDRLRRRFPSDRDGIVEFPYDWRQSNEYTARRLAAFVEPLIERRRREYPQAKLILVGHSMGGLVARYFAECLDEEGVVRRIVTIGTPYSGALKALAVSANGYVRLGPVRIDLAELVRSLPSVAELLPVYGCLDSAAGAPQTIFDGMPVPGLTKQAVERARRFHRGMDAAVAAAGRRHRYHALVSHRQPTDVGAFLSATGEVQARRSTDPDFGGDGTVPRCSATPPEWTDDANAVFIGGRHASLQRQNESLVQLYGILTARPRHAQAVADEIAVDAEAYTVVGTDWVVRAHCVTGLDNLALAVSVVDPAEPGPPFTVPLTPTGAGGYQSSVVLTRPGLFRWTVHSIAAAATPIDPVSDLLLCLEA